jgi:hypothetical protein
MFIPSHKCLSSKTDHIDDIGRNSSQNAKHASHAGIKGYMSTVES